MVVKKYIFFLKKVFFGVLQKNKKKHCVCRYFGKQKKGKKNLCVFEKTHKKKNVR